MAKAKKSRPPKFVKKEKGSVNSDLKKLGVEASKTLPTYDVPIDLISKNEWNPNEMDDDTFNRLVEEIEDSGMVSAIQVVPAPGGKFLILGGEHRYQALRSLGWEKVPCNILTDDKFLDRDLQELLTVRLNVIQGKLNPDKFLKLYEDKVSKYGAEQLQALFGFTSSDAWKKVTKGVEKAIEDAGIGDGTLLKKLKKKTKKVGSVDGLGKILNQLFKEYGSDLKHNFMVFTYGGRQHLYVILSDEARDALDKVMDECRENDENINDVLVSLFSNYKG